MNRIFFLLSQLNAYLSLALLGNPVSVHSPKMISVSRLLSLSALVFALCAPLSCTMHPPVAQQQQTFTIIGTGDLQGRLDSAPSTLQLTDSGKKTTITGGISRIATLIRQIQQTTPNPVLVVSSGDDLMGKYFHRFDGKAIFSLMELAGYEVLTLGNHEFDSGPGVLAEALDSVHLPALCSDLNVQDTVMKNSCQPYILKDYPGFRLGVFSLMTEDFPVVTVTGDVKIADNQVSVARQMVQILQKKGAHIIVALTHIGTDMDRKLAEQVQGINIIFGGHSHNYLKTLEQINNTLIVNGGAQGKALVRLDVPLDSENTIIPASATYSLIPVVADIKPKSTVEQQLTLYRKQLPATEIIGTTEKEWDVRNTTLRNRESSVANLITDTIRTEFQVDIVLYNSGAFRGNAKYPPGPVTDSMLAEIDEFENNVYLMTLQGKYIRQILEHSASLLGKGGFLQGSGIRYSIDLTGQRQELADQNNTNYSITKAGNRVSTIQILSQDGSWHPLDPEQYYRVASNDFLVQLGGDRYFWFSKYGRNIRNTYSTMAAVLTKYFRTRKVINPVGPDGRISFKAEVLSP